MTASNAVRSAPGDSFAWQGGSGAWSGASSWVDTTLGATATLAPATLDSATIAAASPLLLSGPGAAAALTLSGTVGLSGVYQFGSVTAGGPLTAQSGAEIQVATSLQVAAGLTVDSTSCIEIGANPVFWPSWVKVFAGGTLSGAGAIAANTFVIGTVVSSGMTLGGLVAGSGTVLVEAAGLSVGTVFGGPTLAFDAAGATLSLTGSLSAMGATLAGFVAGDAIDLTHVTAGSAAVGAGGLVVRDPSGAVLGTLALQNAAALQSATFAVRSDGAAGTLVSIFQPGQPRALTWTGGSGLWGNVVRWNDGSGIAAAPPTTLDSATIAAASPLLLSGPGAAAALTLSGTVGLSGVYQFGSVTAGGPLTAQSGAEIQVATSLQVAAGLTVDSTSCIEIGANPVFWPSWVKVFAGGTLSGAGTIAANTFVIGTVVSSGMTLGGLVAGSGTVLVEAAGLSVGTVFGGPTLAFDAAGATLSLTGSLSAMGATLAGFVAGDAIDLTHVTAGSAAVGAGGLVVRDPSGAVLGTLALQNAAALQSATFSVAPDGRGGTVIAFGTAGSGGRAMSWAASGSGLWTNAANWTVAGFGAATAPGSTDVVSITGGSLPIAVVGAGAAASLAISRTVLMAGAFAAQTADVQGTLLLSGAATQLSLGTLDQLGATTPSVVSVSAGQLVVAATAVVGALTATGGAVVQVATSLSVAQGVTVDGASCVEIGPAPIFWPSWVKVFAGGTLSGAGAIAANTLVFGTIVASGLRFAGLLVGAGTVLIEAAGATVGTAYSGPTLAFDAAGATLTLTAPGAMAATVANFAAGDAIDLVGVVAASAAFAGGALVVRDGSGATLASLAMQAPSASGLLVLPDGSGGSFVLGLAPASFAAAPAGTSGARSLVWRGAGGASWTNAANWSATQVPGSLDAASVTGGQTPLVVTGAGAAASLAIHRSVLLDGSFAAGTLTVDGTLTLAGGGPVAAGTITQGGSTTPSVVTVSSGTLSVAGAVDLGSLTAVAGAVVQVGGNLSVLGGIAVDGSSCVEVGTNPVFWPGWVKVFAGGTLSGSGAIAANTLVYGTIKSFGLRFGGLTVGAGTVLIEAGGAIVGTVYAGPTLAFDAPGTTLTVAAPTAMAGLVRGFGAGDAFDFAGLTATTAVLAAGTLVLQDAGGHALAGVAMAGVTATGLLTLPDGSGGTLVVGLGPAQANSPGGTASARSLVWSGPSGSVWGAAADWSAGGAAATAAPGALDAVAIVGGQTPLVVTGTGSAASLSLHRSVLLDGAFQAGSATLDGTLVLAGGANAALGSLGQAGATAPSTVTVLASVLAVSGNADLGSLATASAANVLIGGSLSVSGGISVDGSSCVEVGASAVFSRGWVEVAAGGTLSGGGQVTANAAVYGTVVSQGFQFEGQVVGSGTVLIESAGTTVGAVQPGPTLDFDAPGAMLTLSTPQAMHATLAGFGAGDAIDLGHLSATSANFAATGSLDGLLSIGDVHGAMLAQFALHGDSTGYATAGFSVVADGVGGSLLIETVTATAVSALPTRH